MLGSWLLARSAEVVLESTQSEAWTLSNMLFQGTVLGPPLWNIFFKDARDAVRESGFSEVVFADDLNCWKAYANKTKHEDIQKELNQCQQNLHAWGAGNAVAFDPGKESFHILATNGRGEGPDFKMLGVLFDTNLSMRTEVDNLICAVRWKIAMLTRTARFFSVAEIVDLYTAHVLSYVEYRTSAIYHVCDTQLSRLDACQISFLKEVGLTEENALEDFNLAPLGTRRDIAMLGIIHRAALGKGPEPLHKFFQPNTTTSSTRSTRANTSAHSRQLKDMRGDVFLEVTRRSALGLVAVYNKLPQAVVDEDVVSSFQKQLQLLLRKQCSIKNASWKVLFSPRLPMYSHPLNHV